MKELEAKLLVPDEATLEAICRLERLAGLPLRHPRAHTVHDTYLDTAGRRLYAAGYGCRIRRIGSGALVALKGLGHVAGALHQRLEHEHSIPAPTAEALLALPEEPGPRIRALAAGEPLVPLFGLHIARRTWEAGDEDHASFELVVDRARYPLASGERVLLEVELESRDGDSEFLERAAGELRERFGLADSTLSKFHRGLRWAGLA